MPPQDRAHVPFRPPQQSSPQVPGGSDPSQRAANPLQGGTYFLGRYRVVDEIGIGGMASVHLARMDGPGGFQKWVAIKRIHPHLVEDESFVNMFLDEARVAARISHPNVAAVFELGKHEDTYWIAMEYLHGEPLREVMRRTEELGQPMPPEIACRVIADSAEGLHAAHELVGKNGEKLGLVHRDVTPHNLFVTYDGCTKVVDFGIAKFASRMASTRAGTLKGKLAYMSPEQVAGEPIDRRTDCFALGVVLWELTTGQRLFRMDSDLDTLAKVQECSVPRPSTIVRGYPIDLERIVMKALAKTKDERYRTAREFSRALQSLLMRRGLFIASDEVSAYMGAIFTERMQKRTAHLRWAAEVTQTIDIDKIKEAPPSPWHDQGSLLTYNSEIQKSQPHTVRAAPRPAAGMSAQQQAPDDNAPTLAKLRGAAMGPAPISVSGARFDDDFDDVGDTVVSDTPDMDDAPSLPRVPVPAAGAPPPSARELHTQAASPAAMSVATGPRAVPPRAAPTPALPPVVVPSAAAEPSDNDETRPFPDVGAHPEHPRQAMFGDPQPPPPFGMQAQLAPGPADMDRLFAPPSLGRDGRTITAQSLRRRVPVWAVAVGSAVIGLAMFALLVLALSRGSHPQPAASPAKSAAPSTPASAAVVSTTIGPFAAARTAFAATLAAVPPPPPPPSPVATSTATATATATSTSTRATPAPRPAPTPSPSPSPSPLPAAAVGTSTGMLTVICIPGCDQVVDNGAPIGPSPVIKRKVSVGSHRLRLVWNDANMTVSTVVFADQVQTVRQGHP